MQAFPTRRITLIDNNPFALKLASRGIREPWFRAEAYVFTQLRSGIHPSIIIEEPQRIILARVGDDLFYERCIIRIIHNMRGAGLFVYLPPSVDEWCRLQERERINATRDMQRRLATEQDLARYGRDDEVERWINSVGSERASAVSENRARTLHGISTQRAAELDDRASLISMGGPSIDPQPGRLMPRLYYGSPSPSVVPRENGLPDSSRFGRRNGETGRSVQGGVSAREDLDRGRSSIRNRQGNNIDGGGGTTARGRQFFRSPSRGRNREQERTVRFSMRPSSSHGPRSSSQSVRSRSETRVGSLAGGIPSTRQQTPEVLRRPATNTESCNPWTWMKTTATHNEKKTTTFTSRPFRKDARPPVTTRGFHRIPAILKPGPSMVAGSLRSAGSTSIGSTYTSTRDSESTLRPQPGPRARSMSRNGTGGDRRRNASEPPIREAPRRERAQSVTSRLFSSLTIDANTRRNSATQANGSAQRRGNGHVSPTPESTRRAERNARTDQGAATTRGRSASVDARVDTRTRTGRSVVRDSVDSRRPRGPNSSRPQGSWFYDSPPRARR